MNSNDIFKIKDEIAFRKSCDRTLTIVHPLTDKIITINETAAEIWQLFDGRKNLAEIVDCFIKSHEKDCELPSVEVLRRDVLEIIESFLNKDLIEII